MQDKKLLRKLICEGNLSKIRLLNPQNFENSNVLYYTVNCFNSLLVRVDWPGMEILKYFVESINLKCDIALSRALECDNYIVADYLYSKGFRLNKENNISSAKALEWAFNHEGKCNKDAFFLITEVWNGSDDDGRSVHDRLLLLFKLYPELESECKDQMDSFLAQKAEDERLEALPHECNNCEEKCEGDYVCSCCDKPLCDLCGIINDCINKEEWLFNIQNICLKCNKVICGSCMRICHECANTGETDDCKICYTCTKCTDEADIYSVDCPHHNWNYCSKVSLANNNNNESSITCRVCDANRNYHLKMQDYE